jgi:hypothetical protein
MEGRGVLASGDTLQYAMGLVHGVHRGLPYVGHGGAFVGYRAGTLRYPEEGLAVMVLCNYARTNPMGLAQEVGEVLLEARMDPGPASEGPSGPLDRSGPSPDLTEAEAEEFVGEYYSEEVDAVFRILSGDEGLTVDLNGSWTLPLRPQGQDRFRGEFLTLSFVREAGRPVAFRAGSGRAGGVLFRRR